MKMTRLFRLLAAGIALFSLLFTQLAVAAYACPVPGTGSPAVSKLIIDPDMPGCQEMPFDPHAPSLCDAHCDNVPQSADSPSAPAAAPFVQAALTVVLAVDEVSRPIRSLPAGARLTRPGAPPLIIRNCCFRI